MDEDTFEQFAIIAAKLCEKLDGIEAEELMQYILSLNDDS